MKFGAMVVPRISDWQLYQELEAMGYDSAWAPDSQMIYSDTYAVLALAAANFSTADASGSAHVLYGVTGDGATVRETLFTIDTSDASTTLVTPLGNGNDGSVTGTMVRRSPTNPTAA